MKFLFPGLQRLHWRSAAGLLTLILLVGWLIYAMIRLGGAGYAEASAFVSHPVHASLLILLIVSVFYHAMLGLQVVIEDYVHHPVIEVVLYFLTRTGAYFGMA